MAVSDFHTLALKTDGTLWAWGQNFDGQLGLGDTTRRLSPTQVGTDNDWKLVAVGIFNTSAIKKDGSLWVWGSGHSLGLGDTEDRLSPTQIGTDTDWRLVAAGGAQGGHHTLAIKTDGSLWAWGIGLWGELGLGDVENILSSAQVDINSEWEWMGASTWVRTPVRVGTDADWKLVAAGGNHTLSLKTDGTLWAWGYNAKGQLGLRDNINRFSPTQIDTEADWKLVAAGGNHTLAIKTDGTLWAWGLNSPDQLGIDDTTGSHFPVQVGVDVDWDFVAAGEYHTLALKADGTLWVWGNNYFGQLGLGDTENRHSPAKVIIGH